MTASVPGGVQTHMQYDGSDRVTRVDLAGPTGATQPLSSTYAYGYDAATGWTTGMTWTVNGAITATQLMHDPQGRLIQWSGQPNGPESWGYDGNSNLITNTEYISGAMRQTVYTYSASIPNQEVQQHTDGLGVEYFGYDHNGNTTSLTSTDFAVDPSSTYAVSDTLRYDSGGRPVTIIVKNEQYTTKTNPVYSTVRFGYNAQGQRSSYSVSTPGEPGYQASYRYRDSGPQVAQAVVASGTVTGTVNYTDTYLYTQGGAPYELLRQYQGQPLQRYWYEVDGRNDVVALTDSTGNVVDRYAYDPWGEGLDTYETVPQPLRYAGYWWDKELGWYWVNVRSYDPEGRWLQPDVSEADGVRTYVYVDNDPIDATDPSGLCAIILHPYLSRTLPTTAAQPASNCDPNDPKSECYCNIHDPKSICYLPPPPYCNIHDPKSICYLPLPPPPPPPDCNTPIIGRFFPCRTAHNTSKGRWSCQASCNVAGPGSQCTGRVRGVGSGSNQDQACRDAKRNAVHAPKPKGCYARHCRCFDCHKT